MKTTLKPSKSRILRVWIEHRVDENPDTSYLGKFTDEPSDNAIIRLGALSGKTVGWYESEVSRLTALVDSHEGTERETYLNQLVVLEDDFPSKCRECRFFVPAMTGEETGNPDSPMEDWKRMESLNRGEWNYIGIIAKCEVQAGNSCTIQTLRSGGLWGIESDSGPEYLADAANEQLSELRSELEAFGFSKRQIDYAFRNVETVNK